MKELQKQLSEKVKDRGKISDIHAHIFQITEKKKNQILEKQNKKLSHLRTDRNKSDTSLDSKTSETSNKAKTNPVKRGKQKPRKSKKKKHKPVSSENNQTQTYPSSGSATNSRPTENKKTGQAVKPTKIKANQNNTVIDLTTQTKKTPKQGNPQQKKRPTPRQQTNEELCSSRKVGEPEGSTLQSPS